jgi:hypothetical protein
MQKMQSQEIGIAWTLVTPGNAAVFQQQLFMAFAVLRMDEDAFHRTGLDALRFVVVAHAFGAERRVDIKNLGPLRNRFVRAFRFAYIAVDAIVCNE